MRNKAVLLLFLAIPILALASGSALLYHVTYALASLVLLGYLWSLFNVCWLKAEVQRITSEVQAGQWLEERVVVHNKGWLPKLFLEVHHKTDIPGHNNRRVVHILPHSSVTWVARTHCQRRGQFSFGRISIVARDPFGLFYRQVYLGQSGSLIVYPATLELANFLLPSGKILGEGYYKGRTDRSSPEAMGVREYVNGDSFGRIHWRSTARTGKLMVKDFDREPAGPSGEVWVLLDMQGGLHRGEGVESSVECGVTIAASIAKKYVDNNRAVGLIACGDKAHIYPALKGMQQWGIVLEALAIVQAQGKASLSEVVSSTLEKIGFNAIAVVITPAPRDILIESFSHLVERGVKPVAILLDRASFGGGDSPATVDWLASSGIETYIIRQGEEIEKALDSRRRSRAGKYRTTLGVYR